MKLQFDSEQSYQQDAIRAITDIFKGQSKDGAGVEYSFSEADIMGIANQLRIEDEQILENIREIQKRNEIALSQQSEGRNFTVEMETGTGKTYVYLRTIYELFNQYGFKKFVIVVPSVAIREGVLKNLNITHEHFQTLYDNIPVNFQVYDSSKVSSLRSFATGNNIEILVINIDSFAKDENIINKPNDKLTGQKPVEFIQAVNPIVIIDEPQNMETEKRKSAIEHLNPLCSLRYSATHKNLYNLVYNLNPVKAYDLGLVKQIEVDSIFTQDSHNEAFISVHNIEAGKTRLSAKVTIDMNTNKGVVRKMMTVKVGDDLYYKSDKRELYRNGYIIQELDAQYQYIGLSNGTKLYAGNTQGGFSDDIMKYQIRKTIEEHLKKESVLNPKGIKVLSLFFIDKVANYREYDRAGNPIKGKFALWFEEIYKEVSNTSADKAHDGYFSKDKKGVLKDTSGETLADNDAYKLIMQDKERLLDIHNPLRFIFSHSALREGWDNPNVFQICTLNETKSEMKKRQEIGRGLRLAVDQNGQRRFDRNINRLTVIANESYEDFAKSLQKEIEDDCGVSFAGRIKNKQDRVKITYRKGFEADPKFLEIWERIREKTTYRVNYDSQELIRNAAKALKELPEIKRPVIKSVKNRVKIEQTGIGGELLTENTVAVKEKSFPIPDILGYIQHRTELTRSTILAILKNSGRISDILVNPQLFSDLAVKAIRSVLYELMIDGIQYRKIGSAEYEMRLFEEYDTYADQLLFEVKNKSKTIYETHFPLDSSIEDKFANECESSEQVEFYFKLPNWFKIPTPIGDYNPDWAIVFKDEKKIYFVAETKSTTDTDKLRKEETLKIRCGKRHYAIFDGVKYCHVTKLSELSGC